MQSASSLLPSQVSDSYNYGLLLCTQRNQCLTISFLSVIVSCDLRRRQGKTGLKPNLSQSTNQLTEWLVSWLHVAYGGSPSMETCFGLGIGLSLFILVLSQLDQNSGIRWLPSDFVSAEKTQEVSKDPVVFFVFLQIPGSDSKQCQGFSLKIYLPFNRVGRVFSSARFVRSSPSNSNLV